MVICDICASKVGRISLDDGKLCATPAEQKIEVETLSSEGQVGTSESQDESRGRKTEMDDQVNVVEGCGPKIANVSKSPCSSSSEGEKVECLSEMGIVFRPVGMKKSKESEVDTCSEIDVTRCCLPVPEIAAIDTVPPPCSSPEVEHQGSSPEKSLVGSSIDQDDQIMQENSLKDLDQPSYSAAEGEIAKKLSDKGLLVPETATLDTVPPPCSSAAEDEHLERSSEKSLVGCSIATHGDKISETNVTNQDDQVAQEKSWKDLDQPNYSAAEVEIAEKLSDKVFNASLEVPQPLKENETDDGKNVLEDLEMGKENAPEKLHPPAEDENVLSLPEEEPKENLVSTEVKESAEAQLQLKENEIDDGNSVPQDSEVGKENAVKISYPPGNGENVQISSQKEPSENFVTSEVKESAKVPQQLKGNENDDENNVKDSEIGKENVLEKLLPSMEDENAESSSEKESRESSLTAKVKESEISN